MSEPVCVIVVWAPALSDPYPLIPAEHYTFCRDCDSVVSLISRAIESHPTCREAGSWTRAIVVTNDGRGMDVRPRRRLEFMT